MKIRSRLTGTVLVLTLSAFGLAACGGSDNSSDDTKAKDTTSKTDATTDAPDNSSKDGKPSKQEVIDGYTKLVGSLMGDAELPGNIVDKVVTCFVGEVYDDASAQTLKAIAGGDQAGVDPNDVTLFTEASSTCQKAAIG